MPPACARGSTTTRPRASTSGPAVRARPSWRISGAAVAAGVALDWAGAPPAVPAGLFAVSVAAGGWYWARRAWSAARLFALDINTLMLIAVAGAIVIGEWSEAATVTFLFALAQWIESRNMERARLAIRALMELSPDDALVRRGGRDVRVAVDAIAVGDVLIVRPGEKIPLDGTVATGRSEVNQAPITGESLPVAKEPGARGVCRHHQRARRARGARHPPARGHDARAHHQTWWSTPSPNGRRRRRSWSVSPASTRPPSWRWPQRSPWCRRWPSTGRGPNGCTGPSCSW